MNRGTAHVKPDIIILLITWTLLASLQYAWSKDNDLADKRRERCLTILHEALHSKEDFWTNVHAAEALIYNVYPEGVEEVFKNLQNNPRSNIVGICRVRARLYKKNAVKYQDNVNRIVDEFSNPESSNRVVALETLAKLNYSEPLPEIRKIAESNNIEMIAYARWVLANSGNMNNETFLAELLNSNEPLEYSRSAYALRFLDHISNDTFIRLEKCAARLPDSTKYKVYVLSSLYVHSSPEKMDSIKIELLIHLKGEKHERYEVAAALAIRGIPSDVPVLGHLLEDPDLDVRVSAANALLRIERRMHRGTSWPDWTIMVVYILLMLSIGWYFSKRQKTSEDYLVGNRRINSFVSGISLFASFFSTISYLALTGEVIKHGPLLIIIMIVSFPIIYLLTGYFLIPFFMRLPITSAYQILEKPLGSGVRMAAAIIFLLTRFVWMALLIFLTSKAMVVMLNWDNKFILYISLITGIITIIYSTMGGLRAVVTTDVIQFFILLFGAIITVVLISMKMQGIVGWVPREWAPNWDKLVVFSLNPHIRLTIFFVFLHTIAWWICTAGSDQMAIQRFIATRDVKAARRTFLTTQIGEKIIFFILMCVGFSLLAFYRMHPNLIPDGKDLITDADFLFPHFIANHLPAGLSGVVIAALFSAAMSSLSSGINSTSAVITTDIIPWLKKKREQSDNLALAKWCSLIVGLLVVSVSSTMEHVPGNITEVTAKTNGLFVAPLFNLFFMAMFVRSATTFGTIMGSIYGIAVAAIIAFWDLLTGQPGVTFLWIGPLSLVVSIAASMLFSFIPTKGKGWKYISIWSLVLILPIILIFFVLKLTS